MWMILVVFILISVGAATRIFFAILGSKNDDLVMSGSNFAGVFLQGD